MECSVGTQGGCPLNDGLTLEAVAAAAPADLGLGSQPGAGAFRPSAQSLLAFPGLQMATAALRLPSSPTFLAYVLIFSTSVG